MKKEDLLVFQGVFSAAAAWIRDKLGILYPVLILLTGIMLQTR